MEERTPADIDDDDTADVQIDDSQQEQLPIPQVPPDKPEPVGAQDAEELPLEREKARHWMRMEENTFNSANLIIFCCIVAVLFISLASNLLDPSIANTGIDLLKSLALLTAGYQFSERRHKNN